MTNKHAAYTALGANPTPSTPWTPFWGAATEEHPQTATDPGGHREGHTTCWRATSVSSSSWQDPSPSASPHQSLQHSRGSTCHLSTGDHQRPYSYTFQLFTSAFSCNKLKRNLNFLRIDPGRCVFSRGTSTLQQSFSSPVVVIYQGDIFSGKWWRITCRRSPWCRPLPPLSRLPAAGLMTAEEVRDPHVHQQQKVKLKQAWPCRS